MAAKSLSEQIEALNAEVKKLTAEKADLIAKSEQDAASIATLTNDLTTAKQSIGLLTSERDVLEAEQVEFSTRIKALEADAKKFNDTLEAEAAKKAAAIVAAQGIDPISNKPAANHPADNKPKNDLRGIDRTIAAFEAQQANK